MAAAKNYRVRVPDVEFWKQIIPCQAACPAHTDSGRYVQLIAQAKNENAYLTAVSPNPFASVCGRVCAAPCEDQCRRGKIDGPVAIRALKRFVCERYGPESEAPETRKQLLSGRSEPGNKWRWHLPMLVRTRRSQPGSDKVAIIGAGPAGLACAHDLAVMGYKPTVFEASEIAGGMMFHGIPAFRLARELIDKEIRFILGLGAQLKLNTPLTPEFGLLQLREAGFNAVFLAVGAQGGRDLAIEGSQLDGVVRAVEFLLNINRGYKVALGGRVVIIGGGFVAFDAARAALRWTQTAEDSESSMVTALDAARTAVRADVEEVRMLSLESFEEMPVLRSAQGKEEFEEAKREGVLFQTQRAARRFLGKDGHVTAIELIGVKRTYDESGRFDPIYDAAFSETIEADTVILAIGQRSDLSFLRPEDGIGLTPQGTIKIDRETLATSAEGVFAGGDVAFGPRNLIEAIANGKRAAMSIDNYLRHGSAAATTYMQFTKLPTRSYRMIPGYEKGRRAAPPTIPLDRRTGISQVELDYSPEEARLQAERCLCCHIQTIYDSSKCILCGRCVDVCPQHSLKLVSFDQLAVEELSPEQIRRSYGIDTINGQQWSAMIKDEEKCIRCGLCAIRCPTDAMTMEVLSYEDREPVLEATPAIA
jgi:formate dehydrogenase (NADP+) beta subunit